MSTKGLVLYFSTIHKERQLLHKRSIVPLDDGERDNHLFRSAAPSFNMYEPLPAVGTFMDTKSYADTKSLDAATTTGDLSNPPIKERALVIV